MKKEIKNEFIYEGLFSEYLPSNFKLSYEVFQIALQGKSDLKEPLRFSMSRFNNKDRRIIYVPEITDYVRAINYLDDNNLIE